MINLLRKSLAHDIILIKASMEKNDYDTLAKELHRLHGAVCYCNTPPLKNSIEVLEKSIKNKSNETPQLFSNFLLEVDKIIND